MKRLLTLLTFAVSMIGCASTNSTSALTPGVLDFGDYTSQTLTTAAWDSYNAGHYEDAIAYADKCAELYETEAKAMQENLRLQGSSPTQKSAEQIHVNWALNDVGTSYFIKAESLRELGRKEEALAAYKIVMNQFYYAQTWDPKGWFWAPAEAASPRVTQLSGDF